MRVMGVDVPREPRGGGSSELTLVALGPDGRATWTGELPSVTALAARIGELAGGEPFVVGVNTPVVVPARSSSRGRPVENLVRRRFGTRLPRGGRAALAADSRGVVGETLLAALAAAGQPCLPYPDRNRRERGLGETHPGMILKTLLWEGSSLAAAPATERERLFRAFAPPPYRRADTRAKVEWPERAAALDLTLRLLGPRDDFDVQAARAALERSRDDDGVEGAGALLDAALIAGTLRRYLDSPETCLFLGDSEGGYLILPADAFIRRLALADPKRPRPGLFPRDSLEQQFGGQARLRPVELLGVPGRPQRTEARFDSPPTYEFDNVDEMLWWKHCRHLAGAKLPTEGLAELHVTLGADPDGSTLHLARSRHRTLSFRFEPPAAWRSRLPTRDGRTYGFRVLRAIYETAGPEA